MCSSSSTRLITLGAVLALAASAPRVAQAHARLLDPAPRNTEDSNKDQDAPCGVPGEARTANPTVYRPGQTVMVKWEETVDHTGHYELAISMNGEANFVDIDSDIADASGGTPRMYQQQITLPNEECDNCTLRMMQFMAGSASPYYKSCADIVIRAAAADDGGTGGDGGAGGDGGPPPSGGIGDPAGPVRRERGRRGAHRVVGGVARRARGRARRAPTPSLSDASRHGRKGRRPLSHRGGRPLGSWHFRGEGQN